MQSGSGDVSWHAQIGAVQSWTQSSSFAHTFLSYLCSKLDLLSLLSVVRNFLSEGLFLSPSLSLRLLVLTPLLSFYSTSLPVPSLEQTQLTQSRNS